MPAPEAVSPFQDDSPDGAFRLADHDIVFVQSAVSIIAAAQDLDGGPAIARAIGALVEPATGRLRLYLRRDDADSLLAGASAHGTVAAMFSRPTTTQTIQIKGDGAKVEQPTPDDEAARRRYLPAMIEELMQIGFDAAFVCCLASDYGSPAAVLSFAPRIVFDQTPGPRAGERKPA